MIFLLALCFFLCFVDGTLKNIYTHNILHISYRFIHRHFTMTKDVRQNVIKMDIVIGKEIVIVILGILAMIVQRTYF